MPRTACQAGVDLLRIESTPRCQLHDPLDVPEVVGEGLGAGDFRADVAAKLKQPFLCEVIQRFGSEEIGQTLEDG